jgi:hypothetical protein
MGRLRRECWAAPLGGCSSRMSKEHVLSRCVTRYLRGRGWNVEVGRAGTGVTPIPAISQSLKILCTAHNSELSPLDTAARDFISVLDEFRHSKPARAAIADGAPEVACVEAEGWKLERWGVKTFLNHAVWSGCMPNELPMSSITGANVLEYVFGRSPAPPGVGLYLYPDRIGVNSGLDSKIFHLSVATCEYSSYSPGEGWSAAATMPMFLRMTLLGIRWAVCANIATMPAESSKKMSRNQRDHPSKHATLRPASLDWELSTDGTNYSNFTKLRVNFLWEPAIIGCPRKN